MSIDELICVMSDATFFNLEVYDLHRSAVVYRGPAEDIQDSYRFSEIVSIDCPNNDYLCVNIDTSDEDTLDISY